MGTIQSDPSATVATRPGARLPTMSRSPRLWILLSTAVALCIALLVARWTGTTRPRGAIGQKHHQGYITARLSDAVDWTDRFGDGTPDFLRLTDPGDQAAFRRWFSMIAEFQAIRPASEVPREIKDCASLLRFSYREALERHDERWFVDTGMDLGALPGEVKGWHYPDTPLGMGLFRVRAGSFAIDDIKNGAFAEFADAKTLVKRNAFLVSRDVRHALPGDLLFFRQFGHTSPWHSMIVTRSGERATVVYDTGPDHGQRGELRRVSVAELLAHPEPEWRPLPSNPNFLGVYRWNILRGTS